MGFRNFTREFLGKKDGFTKTGVLEIYEDCICKPQPGEELREGGMEDISPTLRAEKADAAVCVEYEDGNDN